MRRDEERNWRPSRLFCFAALSIGWIENEDLFPASQHSALAVAIWGFMISKRKILGKDKASDERKEKPRKKVGKCFARKQIWKLFDYSEECVIASTRLIAKIMLFCICNLHQKSSLIMDERNIKKMLKMEDWYSFSKKMQIKLLKSKRIKELSYLNFIIINKQVKCISNVMMYTN